MLVAEDLAVIGTLSSSLQQLALFGMEKVPHEAVSGMIKQLPYLRVSAVCKSACTALQRQRPATCLCDLANTRCS